MRHVKTWAWLFCTFTRRVYIHFCCFFFTFVAYNTLFLHFYMYSSARYGVFFLAEISNWNRIGIIGDLRKYNWMREFFAHTRAQFTKMSGTRHIIYIRNIYIFNSQALIGLRLSQHDYAEKYKNESRSNEIILFTVNLSRAFSRSGRRKGRLF